MFSLLPLDLTQKNLPLHRLDPDGKGAVVELLSGRLHHHVIRPVAPPATEIAEKQAFPPFDKRDSLPRLLFAG